MKSNIVTSCNADAQRKTASIVIRRRLFGAIIGGTLLVSSGCKVPPLQCADAGPVMPASYARPASWNSVSAIATQPAEIVAEPDVADRKDSDENDTDDDSANVDASGQRESVDAKSNVPQNLRTNTIGLTSAESKRADDNVTFASFIRNASEMNLDEPDSNQDDVNDIDTMNDGLDDLLKADSQTDSDNETADADASTTQADQGLIGSEGITANSDFGFNNPANSAMLSRYQFFNDPNLMSLVDEALVGNQELKILTQEIRIACLETYSRSGEYRPFVTLGGRAGVEKPGRHTRFGAVEEQLEVAPGKGFPDPLPDFLVAADVSWELDIWKRLRNAQNAAAMRYLATTEGRNYIVTRLVAEIAEDYYQLLALDNRLATLESTIELQEKSLEVAKAKKEAGRGTELAVQRFQAEVRKNQSERMIIQQEIIEVENGINFTLGRYPQPITRPSVEYIDLNLQTLSAGIPSQILQNRADIRQAEREITASGLDLQVARARFYPSLSLNAGLGYNAFSTGYLFRTPESLIYGVAGELVGPLINKRAIQADYQSANARQLQAIYDYQQTVLEAHIEVVNEITKVENYRQSIEVKKQQLIALEASVDAASKLFQNARAEYVEVLLAQREYMEAKMNLIEIKQQQLGAIVNAYQALGGGMN